MYRIIPNTSKSFATGSRYASVANGNTAQGIYAQATTDAIFKRLMQNDEVRNSFLSGIIGQAVVESIHLDSKLNPKLDYLDLRELLSDVEVITFMNKLATGNRYKVVDIETNKEYPKGTEYVKRIAARIPELGEAFPSEPRDTSLDLLCKTATEVINVEVQVEPQNYWDIRILSHACGLFNRQFPRGFKWSTLQKPVRSKSKENPDVIPKSPVKGKSANIANKIITTDEIPGVSDQIFRVIGVSIFEYPPTAQALVQKHIPWYNAVPWKLDELRRHYKIVDPSNPQLQRPGIEFFDYNLEALRREHHEALFTDNEKELKEWLEFFATAHLKTTNDINNEVTLEPVKKAYQLIESTSLPVDIRAEYESNMERRYNISHFISNKEKVSKEEGIQEGIKRTQQSTAKDLLELGMSVEVIKKITKLSKNEINNLRTASSSTSKPNDET